MQILTFSLASVVLAENHVFLIGNSLILS